MIKSSDTAYLRLAVVGAHLRGMPLNHELTGREAVFVSAAKTAPKYRLYALRGSVPPKAGLFRMEDEQGGLIEVELWDMPLEAVGSFIEGISAPLGIGTLELSDGRNVHGFICEGYVRGQSVDITAYGGWRAYSASAQD
jgi:allophanate hydrolase